MAKLIPLLIATATAIKMPAVSTLREDMLELKKLTIKRSLMSTVPECKTLEDAIIDCLKNQCDDKKIEKAQQNRFEHLCIIAYNPPEGVAEKWVKERDTCFIKLNNAVAMMSKLNIQEGMGTL